VLLVAAGLFLSAAGKAQAVSCLIDGESSVTVSTNVSGTIDSETAVNIYITPTEGFEWGKDDPLYLYIFRRSEGGVWELFRVDAVWVNTTFPDGTIGMGYSGFSENGEYYAQVSDDPSLGVGNWCSGPGASFTVGAGVDPKKGCVGTF